MVYELGGGNDAGFPAAGLIDVGGTLYGTSQIGGTAYEGTVYAVARSGAEHVVYSFQGGSDGAVPAAGLINVHGTLYGATENGGGGNNYGTVFSVTPDGAEHVIHAFRGGPGSGADGCYPVAGLIDVAGTLYGTTSSGGESENGTVFSVTPAGRETVIHSFMGGADGAAPVGGLAAVGGRLYGTTSAGGSYDSGTVFSVTATGAENVVYSFHDIDGSDGAAPMAGLVELRGSLYGTTQSGGIDNAGTVFSITTGGVENVVHSFNDTDDGAAPFTALVAAGGKLYGTTYTGGNLKACSPFGCGTVFSVTTKGVEKILHSFDSRKGAYPDAALLGVKGTLYGTTLGGGGGLCGVDRTTGCGIVYSVTP
jgi:uncharacterized repeat protein (TIGR03803 family)